MKPGETELCCKNCHRIFSVSRNPEIRIDARGVGATFQATPVTDAKAVKSVVEKFQEKYGAKDVRRYYSKFDVAFVVERVQSTAFRAK
jgi:hypothetical protein